MLISQDWLRRKIELDPDLDTDAGPSTIASLIEQIVIRIMRERAGPDRMTLPEWRDYLTRLLGPSNDERQEITMDPTAKADKIAAHMRRWYEAHRESWIDRHLGSTDRSGVHADEFILALINEVRRVTCI